MDDHQQSQKTINLWQCVKKDYWKHIAVVLMIYGCFFTYWSQEDLPTLSLRKPHWFRLWFLCSGIGGRSRMFGFRFSHLLTGQFSNGRNLRKQVRYDVFYYVSFSTRELGDCFQMSHTAFDSYCICHRTGPSLMPGPDVITVWQTSQSPSGLQGEGRAF